MLTESFICRSAILNDIKSPIAIKPRRCAFLKALLCVMAETTQEFVVMPFRKTKYWASDGNAPANTWIHRAVR
jgi:hypothetical protein